MYGNLEGGENIPLLLARPVSLIPEPVEVLMLPCFSVENSISMLGANNDFIIRAFDVGRRSMMLGVSTTTDDILLNGSSRKRAPTLRVHLGQKT